MGSGNTTHGNLFIQVSERSITNLSSLRYQKLRAAVKRKLLNRLVKKFIAETDRAAGLKISFLLNFFVALLDFAEAGFGKVDKFLRKSFGHDFVGMKIFDKFFVIGFYFLIG